MAPPAPRPARPSLSDDLRRAPSLAPERVRDDTIPGPAPEPVLRADPALRLSRPLPRSERLEPSLPRTPRPDIARPAPRAPGLRPPPTRTRRNGAAPRSGLVPPRHPRRSERKPNRHRQFVGTDRRAVRSPGQEPWQAGDSADHGHSSTITTVYDPSCRKRKHKLREKLHQPHHPQTERALRQIVDLPAHGHGKHVIGDEVRSLAARKTKKSTFRN